MRKRWILCNKGLSVLLTVSMLAGTGSVLSGCSLGG